MKITCTIQRKGGSHVSMPRTADNPTGKDYHFKPEFEGDTHNADVTDEVHVNRFLSIPEYTASTASSAPPVEGGRGASVAVGASDPAPMPAGVGAKPSKLEGGNIQDLSVKGLDLQPPTQTASPAATALPPKAETVSDEELEALTPEELAKLFEAELGRKPHHKAGTDKLIAQIIAQRAENTGA